MPTYTEIPNGDVDPDSPLTTGLVTLLRDNWIAGFGGAAGAPKLLGPAFSDYITGDGRVTPGISTQGGTDSTSYIKTYEYRCPFPGVVNVRFGLKEMVGSYTAYARIYVNGSAVGTERTSGVTTYTYYDEDVTVLFGDLIQLYQRVSNVSGGSQTRDFVMRCGISPTHFSLTYQFGGFYT